MNKTFKATDSAFIMLEINTVTEVVTPLRQILYSDLQPSKIERDLENGSRLEIAFTKSDIFTQAIDIKKNKKNEVAFGRYINGEINDIFFAEDFQFDIGAKAADQYLYKIICYNCVGHVFAKKQVEHNTAFSTVPAEGTSSANIFNRFNTANKKIDYHIKDIFSNLFSNVVLQGANGQYPKQRLKGKQNDTTSDFTREFRCVKQFDFSEISISLNGIYVRLDKGRSILDMMTYVFNAFKDKGEDFAGAIKLTKFGQTEFFKLTMHAPNQINISAKTDFNKIVSVNYQYITSTGVDSVLAESDVDLDFDYSKYQVNNQAQISLRELHLKSPPDSEPSAPSLATAARNAKKENSDNETIFLEIDLNSFGFFKEVNEGTILNISEFKGIYEVINGTYKIYKITEIIEDGYITYSIDDMRKEG